MLTSPGFFFKEANLYSHCLIELCILDKGQVTTHIAVEYIILDKGQVTTHIAVEYLVVYLVYYNNQTQGLNARLALTYFLVLIKYE